MNDQEVVPLQKLGWQKTKSLKSLFIVAVRAVPMPLPANIIHRYTYQSLWKGRIAAQLCVW